MKTGLAGLASVAAASVAGCWGGGYFGSYVPPRQECQPLVVDINSINWVPAGREKYVGNIKTANCLVSPDMRYARLGDNVYRLNPNTNAFDIYVGRLVQRNRFDSRLPNLVIADDWVDDNPTNGIMDLGEVRGLERRSFSQGEKIFTAGLNRTPRDVTAEIIFESGGNILTRSAKSRLVPGGFMTYSNSTKENTSLGSVIVNVRLEFDGTPVAQEQILVNPRR